MTVFLDDEHEMRAYVDHDVVEAGKDLDIVSQVVAYPHSGESIPLIFGKLLPLHIDPARPGRALRATPTFRLTALVLSVL